MILGNGWIVRAFLQKNRRLAMVMGVTAVAALWFQVSGYKTFTDLRNAWAQEEQLNRRLETLREDNAVLEREIEDLAPGGAGIEKRAREELGWSRPDEIVINVPEKK